MSVRIGFLGNDQWSVPSLEAITGEPSLEVVLVVTNPPKPAGRGNALRATPVADTARRLGLPLVEAQGVREGPGFAGLVAARPDVLAVVAYGELLRPEMLGLTPYGAVNLHFSLLPRWRGASPVPHAILAGDPVTGVSVIRMDAGLDTGPILSQLEEAVRPEDNTGSLGSRLAHLGGMLLVGVLRRLPDRDLPARVQDEALATAARRLEAKDRIVVWGATGEDVVRRVRALAPEPAAVTTFRGEPLKIFAVALAHEAVPSTAPPGTIVLHDARGVLVTTGAGGVRVLEVAPAGRRRMPAGSWANGSRPGAGERMG